MTSILLDLGGVVFNYSGRESETIKWDVVLELNVKFDKLSLGEDTLENYLAEYNNRTNQSLAPKEFLREIWDTLDYNEELLKYLSQNYLIYILSDNYRENIEYINKRFNLSNYCEGQFYSYDYGMTKRNPEIFRKVLLDIGKPIEEFTFIDDSDYKIESAQSIGLKSVLYENNQSLFDAIEKLQK